MSRKLDPLTTTFNAADSFTNTTKPSEGLRLGADQSTTYSQISHPDQNISIANANLKFAHDLLAAIREFTGKKDFSPAEMNAWIEKYKSSNGITTIKINYDQAFAAFKAEHDGIEKIQKTARDIAAQRQETSSPDDTIRGIPLSGSSRKTRGESKSRK